MKELLFVIKFYDGDENRKAVKKLVELADQSSSPILLDELGGKNPESQFFSALALLKLGDARAVPRIIEIAGQEHPHKFDLIKLLGDFGDARAVPLLESQLLSDDPAFRAAGAESLGKTGSASSVPRLIPLTRDREAPVRSAAIKSLGIIGDPSASLSIIIALEDKTDYVRRSAIVALGNIGEPAIRPLFDAIVFGNPDYRLECLESLIAMGSKAVASLAEALNFADNAILKPYLIRALGNIGDPAATGAILKALDDDDALVRGDAANALRMMKSAIALPRLEELALNDPNEFVRAASDAAVQSIRGQ
jgi:HEAT repeat protein